MAGKKILKCGIKRRYGYLYYIDKDGDICEVKMIREGLNLKERARLWKLKKVRLEAAKKRNKKLYAD